MITYASVSQVNLSAGLVAYYPFSGNANDASGNGNNAIFNNATLTADRFGNPNSAYNFNGVNNYIQIPNAPSINPSNQISLCAFVRPKGFYLGPCHGNSVLMKGDADYLPGNYQIRFDDNAYTFQNNCNTSIVDVIHQNFYSIGAQTPSPGYTPYINKDQWYCIVYTYDGTTSRFYIDATLIYSEPSAGLSFSNGYDLFFGRLNSASYPYWFNGDLDEVRIYSRAINDQEVTALCSTPVTASNASFTAPDTVCVNSPVNIQNTSTGATNYFWNFCTANVHQPPTGTNLGNVGGLLRAPVYIDYVFTNGNYYGFVTNNAPGGLLRLDFGNSLLNTPAVTDLGNIGGGIVNNTEGVQIANDNGNWYVLIVGGDAGNGSLPSLTTVYLGSNITNNTPTATNWGNIGNLSYPHDLYVFNDNGHWYGLTVNYSSSTITRFDLTTSLSNTPTAVNLGNVGSLNGPTGIQAINDNGSWRVFATNATTSTLTRLDFGSSLLNTPTGVNLGNPNNAFSTCWDIYVLKYCGENQAFVINATGANDIVKLDFGNSLQNTPTALSLGNQGNLNFPHCISKLFRVGADVFGFITNVNNNTLSLLEFPGCTNSSIPNSTAQNPPPITYNTPGVYNINLTVDDGLPTQSSYCKQVVVKNCETVINDYTPVLSFDICKNEIVVSDATKYNPGDTVLIIQMKGAVIDSTNTAAFGTITNYKNAGNYEFNYVKQKTGNVIQLENVITRQYDVPFGKVQLVRVPYYSSLDINNTLTCLPWNGSVGGVLAFNVKDTFTMNADIDVSGRGFLGGDGIHGIPPVFNCYENQYYYPPNTDFAAAKGEGIATLSPAKTDGKGKYADGGGGGDSHNAGGGGGSNAASGGFGGYEFEGSPCDGNVPFDNRGIGGSGLTYNNASNKIFMGGGGGAGHANNPELFYPKGGNGGGICIISAGFIKGNNKNIVANGDSGLACIGYGATGCHEGMGGGGGGGTILLNVINYNSVANAKAIGGGGADMVQAGNLKVGPGGGGGGGACWLTNPGVPANLLTNVNAGNNGVCTAYLNDPWGTTPGQNGLNLFNLKIPIDTVLFKKNIDSARIKDSIYNCSSFDFKGIPFTERTPVVTWAWSFGDGATASTQNTSHTYVTAGTYQVKVVVTDINGCKDSISIPVTTSVINISKSNDTSLCGSSPVQLLAGGGASYSWTPISTLSNPAISNPVATPLVTTIYHVAVTNAAGCTKMDSIKITVNNLPVIAKSNDTSVCVNSPVQLFAAGGSSYSWAPASTLSNPNISNPVATPTLNTTYYVKVTTGAGCFKTDSVKITVKAAPVITKSNDTSICLNSSVQLLASGGSTYSWSPAATLNNPGINNPVATPVATTFYDVTVTNAAGCPKKDSIKVTVNPLPVITKSANKGVCTDSSTQLFASGGILYSWTPISTLSNPVISNPIATPLATTIYHVSVTDAAGCTNIDSIKITVNSLPVITKSNDTNVCINSPAQLIAGGGSSYSWTPVATLSNPNIPNPIATPTSNTTYYVKVTNASGCSKTDSVKITVKSLPVVTKSNDTSICVNSSVQLLAGGGIAFSWSPASTLNNPGINNPIATPVATTFYHVTVTNAAGCTKQDSIKVVVNALPVITKSADKGICTDSSTQLSASGGTSYSWTPILTLNNPNIFNPIATPSATTTYFVTVTNASGCSKKDSIKILTSPLPVISKSNDTSICKNTSVQVFASGGATYLWSPVASLNNPRIPNPVATPNGATTYYVTVTNAGGCAKTDSVKIGINPVPVITKSNDTTICNQTSVRIFATGGNSYLWSPAASLDNPVSQSPVASPLATTSYKVTITDARSCRYIDSVKVSVRSAAVFSISPDASTCSDKPKQLQASGGDSYIWKPANSLNNPNISNPVARPDISTIYTVTIHENTCNETAVLSTNLTVLPAPDIQASSSNDLTCSLGSSQLNVAGATNYLWTPSTGLNNNAISNPLAAPAITTTYKVTGTGSNGCSGSGTVTVKVNYDIKALYSMPNSFTPNHDGINDCFGIKYWGVVQELDFSIYNRWGERVFHTNDPNACWDGKYKNKLQDVNVFVYTIKAKTACGFVERKGIVSLLK